jgi:CARDB
MREMTLPGELSATRESPSPTVVHCRVLPLSSRDDDILDFDFVDEDDEGATREAQRRDDPAPSGRPGGGDGPRGPRRPSLPERPGGWTPLLRLIGVVALAILAVILLVVLVQGCSSNQKRDSYSSYMTDIGAVGSSSAKIGVSLSELLTTPGLKQTVLETKLNGLIQQQKLGLADAEGLDPPGPVHAANENALRALQLRVNGMQKMLATFIATKTSDSAADAGAELAADAKRLTASDVVWADLFQAVAKQVLASEGVTGVTVPASVFVTNDALYSESSMSAVWQRVHGASTGGTPTGLHGTSITAVSVLPAGAASPSPQLSQSTETTIQVSTALAFEVSVQNSGDFQEVGIKVTLTIPKTPTSIVRTATIDVIDSGVTKTVTFKDFPDVPFGEKVQLQVDVEPVPNESNEANNTAQYPVVFSLVP